MQILYNNILNNNLYNSVLLIKKLARNIYKRGTNPMANRV